MTAPALAPRPEVAPLNAAELVFVAQHRELVAGLCGGSVTPEALGSLYDRVLVTWAASPAEDRADAEQLVRAFGIALGDLVVVLSPGTVWASSTDESGTELALTHPGVDVLVYPLGVVARRWSAGETGWLAGYPDEIARGLAELADAGETADAVAAAE
ncbi:DUF3806 domain-containing protein [Cellulomonas cellasea]|uniref:DUF3806 domain-containing protein n=1 Tax=Cellulomonas cellasea TaxID=43670 RepID=A0A7W4UI91_9CELL|nr:DUF3806 domain-containing protein [Cellulomonas cellasea]MBB2924662.1 hypothetical protein [Cellulomonas cellasea]